jgi:hypothetical protein
MDNLKQRTDITIGGSQTKFTTEEKEDLWESKITIRNEKGYIGNVKINAIEPTPVVIGDFFKLDGTSSTKDPSFTGDLYVNGEIYLTGSVQTISDARLKENIESLQYSNNLLKLKPVSFNYKNDEFKHPHYGFIAQDVEKLFPKLVKESNNIKTLNLTELIPYLVNEVTFQSHYINELHLALLRKINSLEVENKKLQKMIIDMKRG